MRALTGMAGVQDGDPSEEEAKSLDGLTLFSSSFSWTFIVPLAFSSQVSRLLFVRLPDCYAKTKTNHSVHVQVGLKAKEGR